MKTPRKHPTPDPATSAPPTLSKAAAALWRTLVNGYDFDDALGRVLLEQALIAYDRAQNAAALIREDGACITGPDGVLRRHPAVGIETAARAQMARLFRELGLTLEPVGEIGRPVGR